MKITKEYDITWSGKNPETGKTLYALRANGNCCIYTDDGELLESTDEAHLQANIDHLMKLRDGYKGLLQVEEHYKKLREHYEGQDATRS